MRAQQASLCTVPDNVTQVDTTRARSRSAANLNDLGHPVPSIKRRVDPFQDEHAWCRPCIPVGHLHRLSNRVKLPQEVRPHTTAARWHAAGLCNVHEGVCQLEQALRRRAQDVRRRGTCTRSLSLTLVAVAWTCSVLLSIKRAWLAVGHSWLLPDKPCRCCAWPLLQHGTDAPSATTCSALSATTCTSWCSAPHVQVPGSSRTVATFLHAGTVLRRIGLASSFRLRRVRRAHITQVLRDHECGSLSSKCNSVNAIQWIAGLERASHHCIDVGLAHCVRLDP